MASSKLNIGNEPQPITQITIKTGMLWFGLVTFVGALATYLTYNEPLTSDAWRYWSSHSAWKLDALRILFAAIFGLYLFWLLGVFTPGKPNLRQVIKLFPQTSNERYVFGLLLVFSCPLRCGCSLRVLLYPCWTRLYLKKALICKTIRNC